MFQVTNSMDEPCRTHRNPIRGRSRPDYIGPGGALIAGGRFYDVYPGGILAGKRFDGGGGEKLSFYASTYRRNTCNSRILISNNI